MLDGARSPAAAAFDALRPLLLHGGPAGPLVRLVLVGRPELRERLACPTLAWLRARVVASHRLTPLEPEEIRPYLEHRLVRAGWQEDPRLLPELFPAVRLATGGVPRRIDQLMTRLLILGALDEWHELGAFEVEQALGDRSDEPIGAVASFGGSSVPGSEGEVVRREIVTLRRRLDSLYEELARDRRRRNDVQVGVARSHAEHRSVGYEPRVAGPYVGSDDGRAVPAERVARSAAPERAVPIRRAVHALTLDIEEYFHAHALARWYPPDRWNGLESRVTANTARLLDLLAEAGARATCFVLGWVAERQPDLVRRIVAAGHELASHGYGHAPLWALDRAAFRADLERAKAILEDAAGVVVRGYRAPSFSLGPATPWAYAVLAETGHAYSSSVHPVRLSAYQSASGPRLARRIEGVLELPVGTLPAGPLGSLPFAGGAWFRLLPEGWTRLALARLERRGEGPVVFYLHPWELDPEQPRPRGLSLSTRLRHYVGMGRVEKKLRRLLAFACWDRVDRAHPAVASIAP
jgi:polysaccharide deacetylase family protein (PEP-CTERM system associated)